MLEWFKTNQTAVLAIAALLSPVIAVAGTVVAAFVSYRAVVTGPGTQLKIARKQFELTKEQLALQERTAAANLLGAVDQKWIEDFRGAFVELYGSWHELSRRVKETLAKREDLEQFGYELRDFTAIGKILLLVGDNPADAHLIKLLETWHAAIGSPDEMKFSDEAAAQALRIIEQRQAGIAARIAAVERSAQRADVTELVKPTATKQDANLGPYACATTAAKWLLVLHGTSLVVAFTFYIQAFPLILSAKDDCPSMQFVADAINAANDTRCGVWPLAHLRSSPLAYRQSSTACAGPL